MGARMGQGQRITDEQIRAAAKLPISAAAQAASIPMSTSKYIERRNRLGLLPTDILRSKAISAAFAANRLAGKPVSGAPLKISEDEILSTLHLPAREAAWRLEVNLWHLRRRRRQLVLPAWLR